MLACWKGRFPRWCIGVELSKVLRSLQWILTIVCVLHEWMVVSNHSQSSLLDFNYSFSFS